MLFLSNGLRSSQINSVRTLSKNVSKKRSPFATNDLNIRRRMVNCQSTAC